ncbi:PfkB family carbohydrate kinase [Vibrio sp. VPAP30]|uniref:PfkB family carbohydrate kinase n=1 Tax=Vibrio sp. VPAP30 TaxID=1647102 RepID=UPI000658CA40|nr:PfkB family carbohydrate kinase [Vibrio sp. VPAP30]KLN64477.1 nucleoside 2-deoxyribosyltransferase [Vibrio sp. VPAP30]
MSKNISIVGGAYFEECCYPRKQLFRGSGVRAACLLSSWDCSTSLSTACASLKDEFVDLSEHLKFELKVQDKREDVFFRYRHPLSIPEIVNLPRQCIQYDYVVESELALVFGMLEGRPIVNARRVVYDPQDGANATHFSDNGSSANEIAIVVSYSEGKKLAGHSDPKEIAGYLLDQPNVVVAIVKCGPSGALVATSESKEWIHAFPTKSVFKVGSGDVFSSTFAYEWLTVGSSAIESAWIASRVTAEYVETGLDKISIDRFNELKKEALQAQDGCIEHSFKNIPSTQIYLAGPFFNTAEQWRIDEIRDSLIDMGFSVFSPIHDVGEGEVHDIAQADLKGLDESGVVLAILDGMDCGTIFEIGYARAKDIPVVVIAEFVDSRHLTMLTGSGCIVTDDFSSGVYKAGWVVMGENVE